jgi:hypothetical protein
MGCEYRIQADGSVKRYHQISYTQIWGMMEYIEHQEDLVGRAFAEIDQVHWLLEQGFRGHIARHHDITSDNFHIQLTFEVPEDIYTYIVLKWPEEIVKVDFDGPTIREERKYDYTKSWETKS